MKLLERFETLSPIYNDGLTNHLPMMVIALDNLKVDATEIELLSEQYLKERAIFDLTDHQYLKTEYDNEYIRLTNYYLGQINKHGKEDVIRPFLNDHTLSLSSALFHCLIRLYYANKANIPIQIAQALAYYSLEEKDYIILGKNQDDIIHNFSKLEDYRKLHEIKFKGSRSMGKFETLLQDDFIKDNIVFPKVISEYESDILQLLCTQYLKTHDFYILHLITGFHALYELKHYYKDYNEAFKQFFLQAQVFLLVNDYKRDIPLPPIKEFETLLPSVLLLSDVHDIKLFYTVYDLSIHFDLTELKQIANSVIQKRL